MTRVPVFTNKFADSWPVHPVGEAAEEVEPHDLLTRAFATDAHYQAFALPPEAPRRRLSSAAVDLGAVPSMVLFVIDVDPPKRGAERMPRTPAWDESVLAKAEHLPGQPFGHWTRGGARFAWQMRPRAIDNGESWTDEYLLGLVAIAAVSGIVCDPTCADWTRLYRAPHATRNGQLQAHGWICGTPSAMGAWAPPVLSDVDLAAALGWLEVQSKAWKPKADRLAPPPRPAAASMRAPEGLRDPMRAVRWAVRQVASQQVDRNKELYTRTRWLAELAARGDLDPFDVMRAMTDAGLSAGLTSGEVRRTVASALRAEGVK